MINIVFSENSAEVIARLDQIPVKIRQALVEKMTLVIDEVYEEYHEKLKDFEVEHGVTEIGDTVIGYIEPTEPKSIAREFGGKGYYYILPSKLMILKFIGKTGEVVYSPSVHHPPSKEYRDIRSLMEKAHLKLKDHLSELLKNV